MKRICFFGGNLNHSGGTERVSTSIANALSEQNEKFEVFTLNLWEGLSPFFTLNENIVNQQLYPSRVSFLKNYGKTVYKLRKYLIENKIDTLIVVESMLSLFSLPAKVGLGINHITWEHFNYNVDLGKKTRRVARYFSRMFSDKIVTLTQEDKEIWEKRTIGLAKVYAIANPSPYSTYEGIPCFENKTVLSVGRLTYQKGFDLLIEAWNKVKNNTISQDWKLFIVGEGEDYDQLIDLVKKYNLSGSVSILPFSTKIDEYYKTASFYCMSSRFEGLGMVLIEAHSFGLPAVSFDCPIGPSEIISHNQSGFLVENGNVLELSEYVLKVMQLDNVSLMKMSEAAKERSKHFALHNIVKDWLNII